MDKHVKKQEGKNGVYSDQLKPSLGTVHGRP